MNPKKRVGGRMKLKSTNSVQDAIYLFTSTSNDLLEVIDEDENSIGVFTISDLTTAIKENRLNEQVKDFLKDHKYINKGTIDIEESENEYSRLIHSKVFSDIIDSLYDGIYITDGDGYTIKINTAYERITGIKAEQVIGYHMKDLIKAGYISNSVSIQVIKEKQPITMMQTLHNGRKIIVSGTPILSKDHNILYVISNVRDITELIQLKHEVEDLHELNKLRKSTKDIENQGYDLENIVTGSETIEMYELANRVAKTDVKLLLLGETGVGKTLIASYIHKQSNRSSANFLELNCGALPASLIEAELFGYEPGAFTGASTRGKKGLLELADQGTLFLDEIGDLPLEQQVKLLKVIDDQKFMPIGSTKVKKVDVRIIAATNKNLIEMVEKGTFREDLYYRICVVPIKIPALRERGKEIVSLLEFYLNFFNQKYQANKTFSIEAFDYLCEYNWPGNIRQLINVIERLVVTTLTDCIETRDLPAELQQTKDKASYIDDYTHLPLKKAVENVERQLITEALQKFKTTRKAAEALKVSQASIVQKMKKWDQTD